MSDPGDSRKYRARLVSCTNEISVLQAFRARCFELGAKTDKDAFDAKCTHVLVEEVATGRLVCCFRTMTLDCGQIDQSYSAQFYDLSALREFNGRMMELGRFCIDPEITDPDILRVAWAALTARVDETGIKLLFGCSSFAGTDATAYLDVFAMLKARHLAPKRWLPKVKAPDVFRYAVRLRRRPDLKKAMRHMPPLLRTYLVMGGWVSDHAVVDRQMKTLHVFTGIEVSAIPAARKRLLRALI